MGQVIVTRPKHDADLWVAKLQQSGFTALALPLIDIAPVSTLEDICAVQHAWRNLSGYTACMFVSSNAVEHFFRSFSGQKTPFDQSIRARAAINNVAANVEVKLAVKLAVNVAADVAVDLPQNARFLAPGPGTAAALLAHGVPAHQIDTPPRAAAQFDSEALWQVVGQRDWRGAAVLIVRGKGDAADASSGTGRDWLMQQWLAQGATVDVVSSYERRTPQLSITQIEVAKSASQDGSVWLFSSSEAVANLTSQPGLQDVNWQRARAIATHPRIHAAAVRAGWGVVQPSRPALPDIADALRSIELKPT